MEFGCTVQNFIKAGKITRKDLKDLKAWMESKKIFPKVPDEILAFLLISCNRDQELSRKTVVAYFESRNFAPDMFNNRDIDNIVLQKSLEVIKIMVLPLKTERNSCIIYYRLEDPAYSKYDLLSQLKLVCMYIDSLMTKDDPPENLLAFADIEKFEFKLLSKLNLRYINQLSRFTQDGLPFKTEAIHIINASAVVKPIMKVLQFCMRTEFVTKFKIHYKGFDMNDFFKNHIPAKYLPSDYGGELPSVEELQRRSLADMRHMKTFFDAEEQMRRKYKGNCS